MYCVYTHFTYSLTQQHLPACTGRVFQSVGVNLAHEPQGSPGLALPICIPSSKLPVASQMLSGVTLLIHCTLPTPENCKTQFFRENCSWGKDAFPISQRVFSSSIHSYACWFCFLAGSHVSQAGFEFVMWPRMTLNFFFCFVLFFFLFMCNTVNLCVCHMCASNPKGQKRDSVTGDCEPPSMVLGIELPQENFLTSEPFL